MSIRGFVLTGPGSLERRSLPEPDMDEDDILVRIDCVGICGSDLEYYRHFKCGAFVPREPFVLGHEFAGSVVDIGSRTRGFLIGDRVAFEPGVPCGTCAYCRSGRYNLCDNLRFFGTAAYYPHVDGAFRELVSVPARNAVLLPPQISYAAGALLEPVAVAVHAVRRARPVDGASVLVTGGGTIGQLVAMVARAFGAAQISVSDPITLRRQFALDHGADRVIDPTADVVFEPRAPGGREGFDIVFEASGQQQAIAAAITAVRKGGRVVQIGTITKDIELPFNFIMVKEIDYVGSFRYCNDFPAALDLLSSNRIAALDVVTGTYKFRETNEAFRDAASGKQLKVQVSLA